MSAQEARTLEEHVSRVYQEYNDTFDCIHCRDEPNRLSYASREDLWKHCLETHSQLFPARSGELLRFRETYEEECRIRAPLRFKEYFPAVNGKPTPDETIYASSSPSGAALRPRRESVPGTPESNDSLSTRNQYNADVRYDGKDFAEMKRLLNEELNDEAAIMRSMARRKRSATPEALVKKCSEPGCTKEFKRPCDLTKHEKTHSRSWKCQEPLCKYHEYGWPTEKGLDQHVNDKHSVNPHLFKCQYPKCPYQSKRESNCKQHMEKNHHGWVYVRSNNNGKSRDQAPAQQQNALITPPYDAGPFDSISDDEDKVGDAAGYQADSLGEPIKLIADYLREKEHIEVSSGHRGASFARWLNNYDDMPFLESFYGFSNPSDPALSPGRQSLSHAPESNDYLSLADNQDNGDINLEDTAGHPASYYGAVFDSSSYRDKLYDAATYEAILLEEPVKLTADILPEQQHVEATPGRLTSYHGAVSDSSSNYGDALPTGYQINTLGERIKLIADVPRKPQHVETASGHPANSYHPLPLLCWYAAKGYPCGCNKSGCRHRRQGNPYLSSVNTKPRENRRKVLPLRINDEDHLACPDSGSENNIISKACAVEHGFRIRRKAKDKKRFEVGNGDFVWSIGRVSEIVRLPGSPLWQKKRWFYVLENCPVPLVMGMEFLREAEILTKYRHLLENCPAEMCNISSLLWIGSPRNRLRCTLDGRQLEAVADTGSDLNLMSLACAEREGFRIDRRMEARTQIVVGSGKVIETLGQVYVSNLTLDWREPEVEPPEQSPRRPALDVPLEPDPRGSAYPPQGEADGDLYTPFHIIENLPCDIVFGHKFLYDTDAFNKCSELLDTPLTKHNRQFEKHKQQFEFMIFRSKIFFHLSFSKKPKLAVDVEERHESDWHAERHRRSKNSEDKIALLPPGDREAARRSEANKVRDWNTAHASCRSCNTRSTT